MICLIPARAGSKRIPGKNTKLLAGWPLIAYTIAAAQQSGVFEAIHIWTDSYDIQNAAWLYANGNLALSMRDPVDDAQPDIEWVRVALDAYSHRLERSDAFAILRPTSPFRTAETIRRAYREFNVPDGTHDSLRAVRKVTENPYKMWTWQGDGYPIKPLLDGKAPDGTPLHSSASQLAPTVYLQTSSLEMSYTSNVEMYGTIAGRKLIPFFTEGPESLSIDTGDDWERAESLARADPSLLPLVALAGV